MPVFAGQTFHVVGIKGISDNSSFPVTLANAGGRWEFELLEVPWSLPQFLLLYWIVAWGIIRTVLNPVLLVCL